MKSQFSFKPVFRSFEVSLAALVLFSVTTVNALAATPLDLLQAPPTSSFKSIAPNLTFMLDDSGSMQWEYLGTNGSIEAFLYGFPIGYSQLYGGQTYSDQYIPGFRADDVYAGQYRSAAVNPNYYNPAATYLPWACAAYPEDPGVTPTGSSGMPQDGSSCQWNAKEGLWLFPNADPNKAYLNPYMPGGWRSLTHWNDSNNANNNTANNGYIGYNYANNLNWYIKQPSGYDGWYDRYPNTYYSNGKPKTYGFWAATYFNYLGPQPITNPNDGNLWDATNYQRVQICPASSYQATTTKYTSSGNQNGTATITACTQPPALPASPVPYHTYTATSGTYTDPDGQSITCGTDADACYVHVKGDGSLVVRTYTQEMQNFANWYQYDRSHILLARAGVSQAFAKLPENFRVNFALLNDMAGGSNNVQFATTHSFTLPVRRDILQRVFQTPIRNYGTPSRIAVYNIGQWLSEAPDSSAPWGPRDAERTALSYCSTTGEDGLYGDACIEKNLSCRQNYLVFATDGVWNGGTGLSSNEDGTDGSAITGPGGQSYTYSAAAPYIDSYSGTLADNAMKFWKNDIQTGLPNDVPTNSQDPAFWQHMVMFGVGLGVNGTSDLPQMLAGTTPWPNPTSGALQRIDDLAHAGLDTRGGYLSAADPSEFANALTTTLNDIVARVASSTSAAVSAQPAGEYKTTTQAFTASYHPNGWWGELKAFPVFRTANGGLETGPDTNWNASCKLTGGNCPSMSGNPTITAQAPADRTLLTWNNNAGAQFSAATTGLSSDLVDYLSGIRTNEQPSGAYRKRTGVLGDIVGSSPWWVGPPSFSYGTNIKDALTNATGVETSYAAFKSSEAQREQVIYAGANDGFVHGFRAGRNDANGDFDPATNDGKEVMAYFPSVLESGINKYTDPDYVHQYYVNAAPGTGDLFYGGAWHTWLVGGLGAGGRAFYALDVTNPSSFSASNVRDEVNPSNIDALCGGGTTCSNDLGNTFGTPIIRRMHNGDWAIIAGNGYNSPSGDASIFIMEIGSNGKISSIKDIHIAGPVGGKANGIAEVTAADLDGDKISDYLYAADLYGHVYRVDVTSSSEGSWGASPKLMYSAKDVNGDAQPITTSVIVSSVPQSSGESKIIVMFGTGSSLTDSDLKSTQGQTVYGIWDGDMADWNSKSSEQYAKWSSPPASLTTGSLQSQVITDLGTHDGETYRTLSNNPVCWAGESGIAGCTTYNQYGWYANLPDSGERVVYNPDLINGALQLNTSIPTANVGLTCNTKPSTGFTMAFNPATGGIFTKNGTPSPFYADKNNDLVLINGKPIMGVGLGATGSIGTIHDNGKVFAVLNQQGGSVIFKQQQPMGPSGNGGRVTWVQLR